MTARRKKPWLKGVRDRAAARADRATEDAWGMGKKKRKKKRKTASKKKKRKSLDLGRKRSRIRKFPVGVVSTPLIGFDSILCRRFGVFRHNYLNS